MDIGLRAKKFFCFPEGFICSRRIFYLLTTIVKYSIIMMPSPNALLYSFVISNRYYWLAFSCILNVTLTP